MSESTDHTDTRETGPAKPAVLTDGVYRLRGFSVRRGSYKRGHWVGRPYGRFVYLLHDGTTSRQVSQMLPWQPGQIFFEANFRLICGMTLAAFNAHCEDAGMDRGARSQFFLSLFKDVDFEAEVRRQGDWLNVWKLQTRLGPCASGAPLPSAEGGPSIPDLKFPAAQAPTPAPGPSRLDGPIGQICTTLALDDAALEELCLEEFSVTYARLSENDKQVLLDLLDERRLLSTPDA
jgi:hypothetical protein